MMRVKMPAIATSKSARPPPDALKSCRIKWYKKKCHCPSPFAFFARITPPPHTLGRGPALQPPGICCGVACCRTAAHSVSSHSSVQPWRAMARSSGPSPGHHRAWPEGVGGRGRTPPGLHPAGCKRSVLGRSGSPGPAGWPPARRPPRPTSGMAQWWPAGEGGEAPLHMHTQTSHKQAMVGDVDTGQRQRRYPKQGQIRCLTIHTVQ